jgi:hypothetical protein
MGSANFEFVGILFCCAHFIFDYAFYFNYDLFSFVSLIQRTHDYFLKGILIMLLFSANMRYYISI